MKIRYGFRDLFSGVRFDNKDENGNNEKPNGSADASDTGGKPDGTGESRTFTQEEVGKLLSDERKSERKKAADDFKAEQDRLTAAAEQKRKDDEAKARGDFEVVETKLRGDIETLRSEKTALEERNKALTEALERVHDDEWKTLPDEVAEAYRDAGGTEDDVLRKVNFLPAARKLVEKLEGSLRERREGTRPNPRPRDGDNGAGDLEAEKRALASSGQYRM